MARILRAKAYEPTEAEIIAKLQAKIDAHGQQEV